MNPDRRELELEAAALMELQARKKAFPLYFYRPVPKVVGFHASSSGLRILAGGNRSGKSHTGMADAAAFALGYRPWILRELGRPMPDRAWERPADCPPAALCFSLSGVRVPIPNEIFVVTGQAAKKGIGETLAPKLRELLGPLIVDQHVSHAGTPSDFILKNGSRIVFGSDEQKSKAFESTNYTANFIDEPIRRSTYNGIRRGSIDQFAPICMTFTPIGPHASWIFRDLYTKADNKRIHVTNVSIYDNPYLSPEAIADFANDPAISDVEKQARLYGRFLQLVDRVYPSFDDKVHVVPAFTPPEDWFRGMVVDPHSVRPWFIAYFTVSPRGEIFFYKEWPSADFTRIRRDPRSYDAYAELFRQLEGPRPPNLRILDPNFGPRHDVSRRTGLREESIVDFFGKYGIYFEYKINDSLEYGEGRVRQLLHYDTTNELTPTNRPKLFFTEDCPNLIASMSFYTAKLRPGTEDTPDESKREETYKDGADCVRYVSVSNIADLALAENWDSYNSLDFDSREAEALGSAYGE